MSEPFYASIPRVLRLSVDDHADTPAAPITVTALALPWGAVVDLNALGDTVEFAAGSLTAGTLPSNVPFLADHDAHPFGYGVSFDDNGDGLVAVMAIPRDELDDVRTAAVVRQMRNGVRTAVSVGAVLDDVTAVDKGDHTHYVVNRGHLVELSSVVVPRFDDARVQSIAATRRPTVSDTPPDDVPDEPDEPDTVEASVLRHPTAAATVPYRGRDTGRPMMTLSHIAAAIANAGKAGDSHAADRTLRQLQAAWTNVVTTDVAGLIRPQWLDEVVGLIEFGAPVSAAFRQGTITSSPIQHPFWADLPDIGVQATQKTAITSGTVSITTKTIPVATYAGGNDVSRQTIDWSTPDFVAEYFRACTEVWARTTDAAFLAGLIAGAGRTITITAGVPALIDVIAAAIGTAAAAGVSGAINFVCSGDVYGGLWGALAKQTGALFGAVDGAFPTPRVVLAPGAAAGTLVIAPANAAMSFTSPGAPVRLQAMEIPLGGVDLAAWGYYAWSVLYPGAVTKVVGYTAPVVMSETADEGRGAKGK